MRTHSTIRRSFGLLTIVGATLLLVPPQGYAAGADRIEPNMRVNSGSASNLAQVPDELLKSESRKRYEAAEERARAALGAEKEARRVDEAPPRVPGETNSDTKDAVCIAGC